MFDDDDPQDTGSLEDQLGLGLVFPRAAAAAAPPAHPHVFQFGAVARSSDAAKSSTTAPAPLADEPPQVLKLASNRLAVAQQQQQRVRVPDDPEAAEFDLVITAQPPSEVRTRTPREVRNFTVLCTVLAPAHVIASRQLCVRCELYYAPTHEGADPQRVENLSILGGTTLLNVQPDGAAAFTTLNMAEASAKHMEREFCLCLSLSGSDLGRPILSRFTTSFYAFSHKKVLERRRNVKLRALSTTTGPGEGGVLLLFFPCSSCVIFRISKFELIVLDRL
eukprot:TRINITY_DN3094_c0_g1_i3.p1 TRINITY_DN3094_c0_g1~~TRINITY_DN3094_c0_g1_i3.p1  ORF type:complete len:294 (-),score=71.49 TRINITY_DN3094_c0_g1_i3:288-1121(-)